MALLDQPIGRVLLVAALLAVASLGLALARRRDGVFRQAAAGRAAPSTLLTQDDLGQALGARATLVQFSSPGCATCPQVRRVLRELAAARPHVVHVEIDATQRIDLVRRLDVLRTPTVLVLGPRGELRARTSGRLDPDAAARALDDAPDGPDGPVIPAVAAVASLTLESSRA
jgi:thiol-disulfide isomerase/thioredoxin